MPRVSDEYRAGKRAEILSAAAGRFARDGFHATSMADIIGDSGMSAGAVYRYFSSKEEIIGAVADLVLSTADETFRDLLADDAVPSPAEAVSRGITAIVMIAASRLGRSEDLTRVAVQVWSEALRNPQIHDRAHHTYVRLRGHYAEVARRWQAAGHLPADADPDNVGAALLGQVQGFLLQHLIIKGTTPEAYLDGVRALLPALGGTRQSSPQANM